MRVLLVARKSLVELLREWQLLLLMVLLPLAFLAITAFGYSAPLLATHPLLVAGTSPAAPAFVSELEIQRYADGRPIFDITEASNIEEADEALRDQTATALVAVSALEPAQQEQSSSQDSTLVTIRGDAVYARFYRASILIETIVNRFADRAAGRPQIIQIVEEPLGAASPQSEFDIYAPGMIVFALLLIIPQTAMLVAREIRWDTLRRLRLTQMRAWDLFGGVSLAQMVIAVLQVVIIFGAALVMGFHNQGSLWLAIVVGLAISFSAIGLGLIVACFVENDSQALNVGATVSMVIVLVSGAFYRLPPITMFSLAGHQIDLFDVFPATHGFSALVQVLSYGAVLPDIAFRLGATLFLSLLYFGLGIIIFQRLQMKQGV